MDESEDEDENPLSHENWMKQTNWKFIKYVIHHKHSMTPEQLKQKPFKEIFKIQHEKLDTKETESNQEEEETTTSPDMSGQDSESDTTVYDTEESESPETHQNHNISNITTHHEDDSTHCQNDSSENQNENEIEIYSEKDHQGYEIQDKLLTTNFEVKVENRKVEGLITYSTNQQIFKF